MARDSRIPHPPGGRFYQIHAWAIEAVGRAAATVLAEIDFLDRAQDRPGLPVATRARVVADLTGFAGEKSVDEALALLVERKWIVRHTVSEMGPRNLLTHHQYSLHADAVADYLQAAIPGVANLRSRESQKCAQKCDSSNVVKEEEMQQQCSGNAAAPVQAAAVLSRKRAAQQKLRRERPSGIVTYYHDDVDEAACIELTHQADEITSAVQEVKATGRQPVPGLVLAAITQHQAKAARDAAQREKRAALDALPPASPAVASAGLARAKEALRHGQCPTSITQ